MVNNTQIKKYKDELSIRISVDKNISFHRAVFHSLDCPVNLHFWWGESEKVLAITGVDKSTNLSVSVPNYFHHNESGLRIKNVKLRKAIKALTGWKDKSVYTLTGEFIPELKMVVFKTNIEKKEVKSNV